MKNIKRIGIYIRVSTEEQAKIVEGSLVSQRKRLEEYVEGQNRAKKTGERLLAFMLMKENPPRI
jgi:DNA invertase Pin-like site-specific DNA recombinase